MMGCVRPPDIVIPPPDPPAPVIGELAKIVLVRESAAQNNSLALLVMSLQGGKGQAWLSNKAITLVGVVDPGDINSKGEPCQLVTKWKSEIEGITQPTALLLDKDDKLIAKQTIPESVTLEDFQKLCTEMPGEPTFAALPYVDADWQDWPQFGKGDESKDGKFEKAAEDDDHSVVKRAGEPVFGQEAPMPGLIPEENPMAGEPIFEDAVPLIPREHWSGMIKAIEDNGGSLDLLVTRIYNQKSEGSCVSNATCQAMEIAQAQRRGKKAVISLSAISLYKRCGRSPGSGSMVSTNLKEILGIGVLPLDTPENKARFTHTMANTGFFTPYPQGWQETAKRFRGNEVFDIRSYDGFITALLRGYPVVYGRSGHSICAVRPVFKNNQLYVKYANSWHESWGENGYGYDSERMIRAGASWAFALRTVVDPEVN
jgi:hypothetical protein